MKKVSFLLVCMVALMTAIYFVSCSKDKDDEADSSNPLVGTWMDVETNSYSGDYTKYEYITFLSNGICYMYERYSDESEYDVEKCSYAYNEQTGKIIFVDDDNYTFQAVVNGVSSTVLSLNIYYSGSTYYDSYSGKKVVAPLSTSQLEKLYQQEIHSYSTSY